MKVNKFYSDRTYLPVFKVYETVYNEVKYCSKLIQLPSKYNKKSFIKDVENESKNTL